MMSPCPEQARVPSRREVILTLAVLLAVVMLHPLPIGATVSGDEGKIAFVSNRDGMEDIWVVEPDGSGLANLTNDSTSQDISPSWSPDGRQIAFQRLQAASPQSIWIMNADGSNQRFLTSGWNPKWSPDGRKIVFVSNSEAAIWVIDVDGSNARRLTPDDGHVARWPVFTPDGESVIFHRAPPPPERPGGGPVPQPDGHAYRLDLATGSLNSLGFTVGPAVNWDVSADGQRIAITPFSFSTISQPMGFEVRDLRTGDPIPWDDPSPANEVGPAWSPVGDRLILGQWSTDTTMSRLVIVDQQGNVSPVTDMSAWDGDPDWQPLNPYPVGLVDTSAGLWHLRDEEAAVSTFYFGNPGDTPFLGDWDCDGVETPGVYRRSDGRIYLRNSNTQGIADYYFFFGNPGDLPMAGDFDGDGCDTVSLYRPSEQLFYISNELGANGGGLGEAEYFFMFGNPGDKPFVGDFDGDGVDTIGLHRESTGLVYIRNSNDTGIAHHDFFYGNPGDRLVAADWNGDGKDSPAVFRPGNTTFYFRFTNTQGIANAQYIWGERHWVPVAGDFTSN